MKNAADTPKPWGLDHHAELLDALNALHKLVTLESDLAFIPPTCRLAPSLLRQKQANEKHPCLASATNRRAGFSFVSEWVTFGTESEGPEIGASSVSKLCPEIVMELALAPTGPAICALSKLARLPLTSPSPISGRSSQQDRRHLFKNLALACQPESRTANVCHLPVARARPF
jgi:hypothetical protein